MPVLLAAATPNQFRQQCVQQGFDTNVFISSMPKATEANLDTGFVQRGCPTNVRHQMFPSISVRFARTQGQQTQGRPDADHIVSHTSTQICQKPNKKIAGPFTACGMYGCNAGWTHVLHQISVIEKCCRQSLATKGPRDCHSANNIPDELTIFGWLGPVSSQKREELKGSNSPSSGGRAPMSN